MIKFSMRGLRFALLTFGLCGVLAACSGDGGKDVLPPDEPVDTLYNRAMNLLDQGERREAAKAFSEVERQHPYSLWATRAQLMEAYADYLEMDYDEAVKVLSDFIDLHPGHPAVSYAYYLRALCHYERIADVRRDQGFARDALRAMQDIISRFPDTVYARDAVLKIALINDHLAGAEMEIGRWYLKQKVYIAAVGRFRAVIDQYQTTSHVPEALERLVEAYLSLGIVEEAKRNAAVLGHNFPGSDWYQDAYRLLAKRGLVAGGTADTVLVQKDKASEDSTAKLAGHKPAAVERAKTEESEKSKDRALPPDFMMMKDEGAEKKAEFLAQGSESGTAVYDSAKQPEQKEVSGDDKMDQNSVKDDKEKKQDESSSDKNSKSWMWDVWRSR